jgi:CBS domain containing-hemolysin-like protein
LPESWAGPAAHTAATTAAFTLITFMHVVFGELIPKTLALRSPEGTSLQVAGPLDLFVRLTRPLVVLMNGTGNALLRWWGCRPAGSGGTVHSVEELSLLVEDTRDAGVLSMAQAEFVRKVFRLSGKKVQDCMVPREQMAALELRTPPEQVLEVVRRSAHTRMPVYEGTPDDVVASSTPRTCSTCSASGVPWCWRTPCTPPSSSSRRPTWPTPCSCSAGSGS